MAVEIQEPTSRNESGRMLLLSLGMAVAVGALFILTAPNAEAATWNCDLDNSPTSSSCPGLLMLTGGDTVTFRGFGDWSFSPGASHCTPSSVANYAAAGTYPSGTDRQYCAHSIQLVQVSPTPAVIFSGCYHPTSRITWTNIGSVSGSFSGAGSPPTIIVPDGGSYVWYHGYPVPNTPANACGSTFGPIGTPTLSPPAGVSNNAEEVSVGVMSVGGVGQIIDQVEDCANGDCPPVLDPLECVTGQRVCVFTCGPTVGTLPVVGRLLCEDSSPGFPEGELPWLEDCDAVGVGEGNQYLYAAICGDLTEIPPGQTLPNFYVCVGRYTHNYYGGGAYSMSFSQLCGGVIDDCVEIWSEEGTWSNGGYGSHGVTTIRQVCLPPL